jgi:hypothetical protein
VRCARLVVPRLGLLLLVGLVAGCATGARPTLGDTVAIGGAAGTATGDPAADIVLQRLEGVPAGSFTATYHVLRRYGGLETDAVVAQQADEGGVSARSVTVGNVRAIESPEAQTCPLDGSGCESGVNNARISDYTISFSFSGESAARRLRVALARRSADPTGSEQTFAGLLAQCVSVPLDEGAETYCATEAGPLASWDANDVSIELESFTNSVDPALLAPPAG